jgi:hypothetical protein
MSWESLIVTVPTVVDLVTAGNPSLSLAVSLRSKRSTSITSLRISSDFEGYEDIVF